MLKHFIKAYHYIVPYLKIIILFFLTIGLLKTIDSIILFSHEDLHVFQVLSKMIAINISVYLFYALLFFPFYALLYWLSKKTAIILSSTLCGFFVFSELAFSVYTINTTSLLGVEFILRPLFEVYLAINGVINIFWVLLILISIVALFIFLAFIIQKRNYSKTLLIALFTSIILSPLWIYYLHIFQITENKPSVNNYIQNKSWFCIQSCYNYISIAKTSTDIESLNIVYNQKIINNFINEYPNRLVIDTHYPLERENNISNSLGPFFVKSKKPPNIVIIIVESLGRVWSNNNENNISFTPFFDSIATTGLYWNNCISTTSRSYGAVPAITGSLPYGMKGFQFGNMPKHNSLISILKSNNYQTNAFYGGDFSFDCISEYLLAQKIDYMSPFYQEYKTNKSEEKKGNWWGYFDKTMFIKTLKMLNSHNYHTPILNIITTITAHENLDLKDKIEQDYYIEQVNKIIAQLPKHKQKNYNKDLLRIAATYYTDDCLRLFINAYSKRKDFNNTIFIITGDHSTGLNMQNRLSFYHVPLLIWSPLLKNNKKFPSIVTHNDITPSIIQLLKDNFSLSMPKTVHWVSDGLDTSSVFRSKAKMIFITYSREIREILYENYLYHNANIWEKEAVYLIDSNLSIHLIENDSLKNLLESKLAMLKYINNYTYHNDKLTQNPIYKTTTFYPLHHFSSTEIISCITPTQKPSKQPFNRYYLLPPQAIKVSNNEIKKIKIDLKADVYINDSLFQDEYMDLEFSCQTGNQTEIYKDKIVKFISHEIIRNKQWYHLDISKIFLIKDIHDLVCTISITTAAYDEIWVPNSRLTIKNIKVNIEGIP